MTDNPKAEAAEAVPETQEKTKASRRDYTLKAPHKHLGKWLKTGDKVSLTTSQADRLKAAKNPKI